MENIDLFTILGTLVLFVYGMQALFFAGKILEVKKKNVILYIILSISNIVSMSLFFYLKIPTYLLYIIIFLVIMIEFYIMSKAKILQVAFGALVFVLNISPIHLLTVMIMAYMYNLTPSEIYYDISSRMQSIFWAFSILSIMLIIVSKFLPKVSIIKLSKMAPYNIIVATASLLLIINTTVDSFLFTFEKIYFETVIIVLANALFSLVIFYYLFLFTISLMQLHAYKRKSDEAKSNYHKVINEMDRANKKMYSDDLTGLYNRKYINKRIDELLKNKNSEFAVVFMDMAGLKYVNDTYGHAVGDKYINIVAKTTEKAIREHDTAARVGGDEFIVILEDLQEDDVDIVLQRVKDNLENENKKEEFVVYANMGSIHINSEYNTYTKTEIFKIADDLMREDKKAFYMKMGKAK